MIEAHTLIGDKQTQFFDGVDRHAGFSQQQRGTGQ